MLLNRIGVSTVTMRHEDGCKVRDSRANRETCRIAFCHIRADQGDCCGQPCGSNPFNEVTSFDSLKGHRWIWHRDGRRFKSILSANFTSLGMCQADSPFFSISLAFQWLLPIRQKNEPLEKMRAQFPQYSFSFRAASWPKKAWFVWLFHITGQGWGATGSTEQALRPFCPACLRNGSALERMPNGTISLRFVQAWILVTCILQNRFGTGTSGILTMSYAQVCWNLWK